MKIILESMALTNFKGVKILVVDFGRETTFSGQNATYKTTIFDAFLWCLFGKDSTDRTVFELKTLDKNGQEVEKIDHEVLVTFRVDDEVTVLKRVMRDKWTKKRGGTELVNEGNEQLFFWNDVPKKAVEYSANVSDLLKEGLFKLLTNTGAFNGLPWERRRSALLDMAGEITPEMILDAKMTVTNKGLWTPVINILNGKKSIEDQKQEINFRKKALKDELEKIPARIDEVRRGIVEGHDFPAIQDKLNLKEKELIGVESGLQNSAKALADAQAEQREIQAKIYDAQRQQDKIKDDLRKTLEQDDRNAGADKIALEHEIARLDQSMAAKVRSIDFVKANITANEQRIVALRAEWNIINAEKLDIDEHALNCPTCKQLLPEGEVVKKTNELTKNFNENKTKRLERNKTEGVSLKNTLGVSNASLIDLQAQLDDINTAHADAMTKHATIVSAYEAPRPIADRLSEALQTSASFIQLGEEVLSLQAKIKEPDTDEAATRLRERKTALVSDIDALKNTLALKEANERAEARLEELSKMEREKAQQLADLEGTEDSIKAYEKAKMEILEQRVNGMFSLVKFQMFETQINGGEVPCCKTMIPGPDGQLVPYADANTGAQINAGIDIINTLSRHYNVFCPVWVDNAESVTDWLVEPPSQVIYLRAVPGLKKLKVDAIKEPTHATTLF